MLSFDKFNILTEKILLILPKGASEIIEYLFQTLCTNIMIKSPIFKVKG